MPTEWKNNFVLTFISTMSYNAIKSAKFTERTVHKIVVIKWAQMLF